MSFSRYVRKIIIVIRGSCVYVGPLTRKSFIGPNFHYWRCRYYLDNDFCLPCKHWRSAHNAQGRHLQARGGTLFSPNLTSCQFPIYSFVGKFGNNFIDRSFSKTRRMESYLRTYLLAMHPTHQQRALWYHNKCSGKPKTADASTFHSLLNPALTLT